MLVDSTANDSGYAQCHSFMEMQGVNYQVKIIQAL